MKYTKLGKSDIKVSKICLGGMSFGKAGDGWHKWTLDLSDTQKVISKAVDMGINFIDTANVYANGSSEEFIGKSIKNLGLKRENLVLASKVFFNEGGNSKIAIEREIEGTLKRLGTDYLDLYILHRFDYNTPIEETLYALDKLVRNGKVRALGVSAMYGYQFHNFIHAIEVNNLTPLSSMQCHYNLLYREDERDVLPLCKQYEILSTPYSPMASGHLVRSTWNSDSIRSKTDETMRSKYNNREKDEPIVLRVKDIADKYNASMAQVALAWHWALKDSAPIVGCSKPERVEEVIGALDLVLSNEDINYLEELYTAHDVVGPLARPGEKSNAGSTRDKK